MQLRKNPIILYLQTNRTNYLQLSGESSPTDPVFDPVPPDFEKPSSAKRLKSDITGVYDNVQEALAAQSATTTTYHPEETLSEDLPKSVI